MTTIATMFTPAQRERLRQQIPMRYSCRRFSSAPSMSDWAALAYAAQRFTLPGVRIALCPVEDALFTGIPLGPERVSGCRCAAVVIASSAHPNARIHAGVSGEALVLEAAALGLGSCWVSGTYRKRMLDIALSPDESVLSLIALGVPASPMPARRSRKEISRICAADFPQWSQTLQDVAKAVQWAPSAMNLQPWQMALTPRGFTLDGSDRSRLDIGIALCHAEVTLEEPHQWVLGTHRSQPLALLRGL